jgi:hypothetical protein
MNASIRYVCPVVSLDATHLSSKVYIATVKTALNEIYTVALSIERTNECYEGWNSFLSHLKNACSLLKMKHPLEPTADMHILHLYLIGTKVWYKLSEITIQATIQHNVLYTSNVM